MYVEKAIFLDHPRPLGQEFPACLSLEAIFSWGLELVARPENSALRRGVEAVRIEHGALVVVAEQNHLALHHQVDALARIRSIPDNITQAINLRDVVFFDIRED